MTTAENVGKAYMLSEVEKQIRKDIPRLMELREGCWVHLINDFGKTLGSVKVLSNVNDGISYLNETLTRIEYRSKEFFEIIGHDIMVNDVLEWLGNDFSIDAYSSPSRKEKGKKEIQCTLADRKRERYDEVFLDISSPYLKDQSEETIRFLYNLTNK